VNARLLPDCEGTFLTLRQAFPAIQSDADWWVPVNCVLLRNGDTAVLVDTGVGPQPRAFLPDLETTLLEQLEPGEVDVVVHTHLHVDHVGWTGSFPNARYVVHELDWKYFMSEASLAQRPHLREKLQPLADRFERVTGEVEVAPGVRAQPAPGHTPGHMIVRTADAAVIGDLVAHELQVADPGLVFVNDMDGAVAAATRARVVEELARNGVAVAAGHFRGIGRFERAGKGFRWAVE
jgi:glyoxylase-like metal-dependent hydrolase (beta-lactamase superfamily II)